MSMSYQQTQLSLILASITCLIMGITRYIFKQNAISSAITITSITSIIIVIIGYAYIQKKHPLNNEPNLPFAIICFFFYTAIPASYLILSLVCLFINMASILHIMNQVIPNATICLAIGINLYMLSVLKTHRLLDIESEMKNDESLSTIQLSYLSAQLPNIKSYQPPKELK